MGGHNFVQMVLVTWPRWPPCPYMAKTLKNLLLRNQKSRWPWNLVCSIRCSSITKFLQMMTLCWPWSILRQGQIWSLLLLCGEKGKTMDFSESIFVYDLKLATDDRNDMNFLLTSKLCTPGGCMPPAPGLYTCIKSCKKCIKSDFKEISLKLSTNG